jgi:hypothetical protein
MSNVDALLMHARPPRLPRLGPAAGCRRRDWGAGTRRGLGGGRECTWRPRLLPAADQDGLVVPHGERNGPEDAASTCERDAACPISTG